MADENAPCADLVQERLKVRTHRERIAELETALAKAEEDRNFWASDALEEVTRVWAAKDNTDRWRRYAEHWRGRVRGASEAVRAAMGREKSAWAAWQVVTASLGRERERAEKAEAEREGLIRQRDALKKAVRTMCDWRARQAAADEITVLVLQRRLIEACAEQDRLDKIVSSMYAELGADEESGDDPAAEVTRCVAEREWLRRRVAELEAELLAETNRANDLGFRLAELEHRGVETAFALQEAQAGQERLATRVAELERALLATARALEEDAAVLRLRIARGEAPGPADLVNPTGAAENARAALSGTAGGEPTPQTVDPRRGVTGAKDMPTSGRR